MPDTAAAPVAALHPVFDRVLRAHGVAPSFAATCGQRRMFFSPADADAYDAAWRAYPHEAQGVAMGSPQWQAVRDAEHEEQERDDVRAAERARAAAMDDTWGRR